VQAFWFSARSRTRAQSLLPDSRRSTSVGFVNTIAVQMLLRAPRDPAALLGSGAFFLINRTFLFLALPPEIVSIPPPPSASLPPSTAGGSYPRFNNITSTEKADCPLLDLGVFLVCFSRRTHFTGFQRKPCFSSLISERASQIEGAKLLSWSPLLQ